MKLNLSTGIIIFTIAFSSCVSSKKYKSLEAQAASQAASHKNELATCNTNVASANAKIGDLNKQVSGLTTKNASLSADAAKYKALEAEAQHNYEQLHAALAEQGTSMNEIETKLIAGLSALIDSGIIVTYKEGLLHISLPEKMLFKPGSATLGKSSKEALSPLASILNEYPKVAIYVIGHTDTVKIHTARFEDNWTLSTERANSVVRVLRDSYAIDPARLLAAGRSKYSPVASNDTKEGKALNRRIDIILNPNLIKLYEVMIQTGN